jgi:methylthioribose-1-phosphate isomerase
MDELERTIEWHDGTVVMIDQRVLPLHYEIRTYTTYQGVAEAIHTMVIRGAPAIGAAAGFGMALAGLQSTAGTRSDLLRDLEAAAEVLRQSRPTAVNLFWAIDRMLKTSRRFQTSGRLGSVA